jgi:cytochrome c553
MHHPGKPHPAVNATASFFKRRSHGLGYTGIVLATGVLAGLLPKLESATVVPAKSAPAAPAAAPAAALNYADFQKNVQPFLAQNCYECHGETDMEANVRLDLIHDDASLAKNVPTLAKALKMLEARKMPPKEQPHPTEDQYRPVVSWISDFTNKYYMEGPLDPGRVTIHRLNRVEYDNTIRDLFGFTDKDNFHPSDNFPADSVGFGFDNNSDVLTIAPMLFEKYIKAAELTLDRAVFADPVVPPPVKEWDDVTKLDGDIPPSAPAPAGAVAPPAASSGPGGPAAASRPLNYGRVFQCFGNVYMDYVFPQDGDYVLGFTGYESGGPAAGGRGPAAGPPANVLFYVDTTPVSAERDAIKVSAKINLPLAYSAPKVHVTAGKHRIYLSFRNGVSVDDYKSAVAAAASAPAPDPAAKAPDPAPVAAADAPAPDGGDAAPAAASASAPRGQRLAGAGGAGGNRGRGGPVGPQPVVPNAVILGITSLKVEGPLFTNSSEMPERMPQTYHTVMVAQPSDPKNQSQRSQAAEKIIRNFASRAYRRPATDDEVKGLVELFNTVDTPDRPFEKSVTVALQAVLLNTNFLFRIEQDPQPGEADNIHTLNEYELASRLSYFLWSSMPDDELFNLAGKGQLRANLDKEVARMLKDPKSQAFVENFAGQWLQLRRTEDVSPDPTLYPNFDPSLPAAMFKETMLFFASIKDEDHDVVDLINANYSFVNAPLAKLYGLEGNFTDTEFKRVTFPKDSPRGGLITQASVLATTSYFTRTSPVQRGKWVLENILDDAPPPPPPNVPALDDEKQLVGTLRQQMEQHRANPACASCHERMDAIGFSLENFDPTGAWRDKYANNDPIDASGGFPDGTKFVGAQQMKQTLLASKDKFYQCLATKMLTYAIGRSIEPYDQREVATIFSTLKQNGGKFSALIQAVVHSDAFQKRRGIETGDNS